MYAENSEGVARRPLSDDDRRLVTISGSGQLAQATLEGRVFHAANQAHVTTTEAMALIWTGLGVGNPADSGKNYVMHEFSWGQEVKMNTEGVIGLFCGTIGDMAQAITPVCGKIGAATSAALVDNGATIAAPKFLKACGSSMEGAISVAPSMPPNVIDLQGSIVIPPGYALLSYTFAIQTSSIQFGFVWEEVDV